METTAPRRSSNGIALPVAIAALTLSLLQFVVQGCEHTHIRFTDKENSTFNFVGAEYGILTIGHVHKKVGSQKELNRLELQLRDDGLLIELIEDGDLVGKWSLTRDTDTLTRIGGAAKQ